ncbi:hypothetical protein INT47_006957 [Mucor saturninus]|uniref:Uncharacterized protein n=1 Tax=Mucor saturninus TaxID=64648 RepID=A0A8H7QSK0_9FUNG|nr:hypothetical protein INT47_006957 [Mucor saturninus]
MEILRATGTVIKHIFMGVDENKHGPRMVKKVPSTNNVNPDEKASEPETSSSTDRVLPEFSQQVLRQIFGKQKEPYNENNYKKQAHQLHEYALKESIDVQLLIENPESYCDYHVGQKIIPEHLQVIHREHLAFMAREKKRLSRDLNARKALLVHEQQKFAKQQRESYLQQDQLLKRQRLVIEKQKKVNDKLEKHLELGTYRNRYLHETLLDMFAPKEQEDQPSRGISVLGFIVGAAFILPRLVRKLYGLRRTLIPKAIGI